MFEKLRDFYELFRVGKSVADPALWKSYQVTSTMLGGVIIAGVKLAKVFNYDLPIDEATADTIAGGVIAAVNVVLTITTTDKIGLLEATPTNPPDNEQHINLPHFDKTSS